MNWALQHMKQKLCEMDVGRGMNLERKQKKHTRNLVLK